VANRPCATTTSTRSRSCLNGVHFGRASVGRRRHRRFESDLLQRRVRCEPIPPLGSEAAHIAADFDRIVQSWDANKATWGHQGLVTQLIQELIPEGRQRAEEHQRGQASGSGVRGRAPGRLAGQLFFGVRRAVEVTESVAAPLLRAGYAQFEAGPQWPLGWRDSDGWVLPLCGRCLEPVAGSRRFGEAVHSFPCHLLWGPSNGRNRRRD